MPTNPNLDITALECAQSFPEMVPRAKARIRELKRALSDCWDPWLQPILETPELAEINPNLPYSYDDLDQNSSEYKLENISCKTKWFWVNVWRMHVKHDPRSKELLFLQQYIKYVQFKAPREKRDLTKIKAIPIQDLYSFPRLERSGRNFRSLCPFHNEGTPSFYIYTKDNKFHCFGCSAHGDSIEFYMRISGKTFLEAVKDLGGDDDGRRGEGA